MVNKKSGTLFEKRLCEELAKKKIWTRLEYPAEDGSQPFDVKAIYKGEFYAFECKDCANGYFQFSRIEDNQEIALTKLLENLHTHNVFFAFNYLNSWIFIEASDILYEKRQGRKRIKLDALKMYFMDFDELVKFIKNNGDW